MSVNAFLGVVACTERTVQSIESHASVELSHVASTLPNLPGLGAFPCCPPFVLAPSLHICTLFLAEGNNHHNTQCVQNVTVTTSIPTATYPQL